MCIFIHIALGVPRRNFDADPPTDFPKSILLQCLKTNIHGPNTNNALVSVVSGGLGDEACHGQVLGSP